MIGELREAFERHQKDGCVQFQYETSLWYGRLG
jgi:hypothetical protein